MEINELVEDLKNETWVMLLILNDALNLFYKLAILQEFIENMNPYFKPTFNKIITILKKMQEVTKDGHK